MNQEQIIFLNPKNLKVMRIKKLTLKQISNLTGVSVGTISSRCKEHNLKKGRYKKNKVKNKMFTNKKIPILIFLIFLIGINIWLGFSLISYPVISEFKIENLWYELERNKLKFDYCLEICKEPIELNKWCLNRCVSSNEFEEAFLFGSWCPPY